MSELEKEKMQADREAQIAAAKARMMYAAFLKIVFITGSEILTDKDSKKKNVISRWTLLRPKF